MARPYQGGPSVEIFTATGSKPLEEVKINVPRAVKRTYDKGLKAACVVIDGDVAPSCRVVVGGGLGLRHPVVVVQMWAADGAPLYFEFVGCDGKERRRVVMSTATTKPARDPLHVRIPLQNVTRGVWLNLCFDTRSIFATAFPSFALCSVDQLTIGPSCRIRKILSLRDPSAMPTFPPSVPYSTQFLSLAEGTKVAKGPAPLIVVSSMVSDEDEGCVNDKEKEKDTHIDPTQDITTVSSASSRRSNRRSPKPPTPSPDMSYTNLDATIPSSGATTPPPTYNPAAYSPQRTATRTPAVSTVGRIPDVSHIAKVETPGSGCLDFKVHCLDATVTGGEDEKDEQPSKVTEGDECTDSTSGGTLDTSSETSGDSFEETDEEDEDVDEDEADSEGCEQQQPSRPPSSPQKSSRARQDIDRQISSVERQLMALGSDGQQPLSYDEREELRRSLLEGVSKGIPEPADNAAAEKVRVSETPQPSRTGNGLRYSVATYNSSAAPLSEVKVRGFKFGNSTMNEFSGVDGTPMDLGKGEVARESDDCCRFGLRDSVINQSVSFSPSPFGNISNMVDAPTTADDLCLFESFKPHSPSSLSDWSHDSPTPTPTPASTSRRTLLYDPELKYYYDPATNEYFADP